MELVVEKIEKVYETKKEIIPALTEISLNVVEGEFVVLIGASGCGKTTLLNIIAGLLKPTKGEVYFNNYDANIEPKISMVFQEVGIFPWLTVRENIAFAVEDKEANKEKIEAAIKLVGLKGAENAYPKQLSGGMKQKVGIARALVVEPDLLLMDEPFSAIDAQARELMQAELLRIWLQNKIMTIYVTHNITEAIYLADRIVVLSKRPGKIIAEIKIDLPQSVRREEANLLKINQYEQKIWQLIKADVEAVLNEGIDKNE